MREYLAFIPVAPRGDGTVDDHSRATTRSHRQKPSVWNRLWKEVWKDSYSAL